MMVVDYGETAVTTDYTSTPCGATVESTALAPVEGSTKAILTCKDHQLKIINLQDKNESPVVVNGGFDSDGFVLKFRDRRLSFVHGLLSGGGTRMSLWDIRDERSCHQSCGSCGFLATEFGCLSCSGGQVLRLDGSCRSQCLGSDEYVDQDQKCQKCHSSCSSCSSGGHNGCLTCPAYHFRRTDGSCGPTCYSSEYVSDPLNRLCSRCHHQCLTCSGGLTSQCLSCQRSAFRYLSGSWCRPCSSRECPRCSPDSSCFSCALSPSPLPKSCPESTAYSLALRVSADQRTDENLIYLVISLDSKEIKFNDLQLMIDYGFFKIKADSLRRVGKARYRRKDNSLLERGTVSTRFNNSLEYLVHKGNISEPITGEFTLEVSVNNTAIRYQEPTSDGSTSPSLILLNRTRSQLVILPKISFVKRLRHSLIKRVNNSLDFIRVVGASNAIISSIFLSNFLGAVVRFFQIVEILINLSLVNSRLGVLMEFVMEVLRALKFPLRVSGDMLWPEYKKAADQLFWKYRFKLTLFEKELFVLCNELFVVVLYLASLVVWLIVWGIENLCCASLVRGGKKSDRTKNILKNEQQDERKIKRTRKQFKTRSYYRKQIRRPQRAREKSILVNTAEEDIRSSRSGTYHRKTVKSSQPETTNSKRGENIPESPKAVERKQGKGESMKLKEEELGRKSKVILVASYLKEAIFLFAFFDIQFIVSHELLHSDLSAVTQEGDHLLRSRLSYTLSVICLTLILIDLLLYTIKFWRIVKRVKRGHHLTENDKIDAEFMLEDLKVDPKVTTIPALSFNMVSVFRFSLYQIVVVSLQLFPEVQTGSLFVFQLLFFVYYSVHYKKHKFFKSCYMFIKHLIFEGCILLFLLIAFVFSFKNDDEWMNKDFVIWIQITAAGLIVTCVLIESLTLICKLTKNLFDVISRCCCCYCRRRAVVSKYNAKKLTRKDVPEQDHMNKTEGIETARILVRGSSRLEKSNFERDEPEGEDRWLDLPSSKSTGKDKRIENKGQCLESGRNRARKGAKRAGINLGEKREGKQELGDFLRQKRGQSQNRLKIRQKGVERPQHVRAMIKFKKAKKHRENYLEKKMGFDTPRIPSKSKRNTGMKKKKEQRGEARRRLVDFLD